LEAPSGARKEYHLDDPESQITSLTVIEFFVTVTVLGEA
jgi:hypothetical protein